MGGINKMSTTLKHIVVQVDEAIVHVYLTPPTSSQLLVEFKQTLTGAYFYDKHQPHAPTGQYHLHVYLKNNEIFAINWDGTAHDQSHQKKIPGKVFTALKARFPKLVLPANRIIECVTLDPSLWTPQQKAQLGTNELQALRCLIFEEVKLAGLNAFPPFSRFAVYEGDHVPFAGRPVLIIGAEYDERGVATAEGHLFYIGFKKIKPDAISFSWKPSEHDPQFPSRLEWVSSRVLEWAAEMAHLQIETELLSMGTGLHYPKFAFQERSFSDLLRIWAFGRSTKEILAAKKNSGIDGLKANLELITKFPQLKWSA